MKSAWTTRHVLDQVLDIMQAGIVRLRKAMNPPDLMLLPDVSRIVPLEFYRGKEAITAGRVAAQEKLAEIKSLLAAGNNPAEASRRPAA
ncbi:MAG: hypothetical protein ACYC9L_00755 [Sulfuricaulis sp.]